MLNPVLAVFLSSVLLLLFFGIPCALEMQWVPSIIKDIYPYGKAKQDKPAVNHYLKAIDVPKRWFTHFYWSALFQILIVLVVLTRMYIYGANPPVLLQQYLSWVAFHHHYYEPIVAPELSLLGAICFFIHIIRRLYETLYVNIFSEASMNLFHYLIGVVHYWGCCTILVAYAADFSSTDYSNRFIFFNPTSAFKLQQLIGITLFLFASYQQYAAHNLLAIYRRKSRDKSYFLPRGQLFDYVSCPNFFCEIIIYISLYIILGFRHYPWALVTIWVFLNQTLSASMAHKWYRVHFKEYPSSRRAIIPFIY